MVYQDRKLTQGWSIMIARKDTTIFISIRLHGSFIMEKVATNVYAGESYIKCAKELRAFISKYPKNHGIVGKINPSDLSWGIYKELNSEFPMITSDNWI